MSPTDLQPLGRGPVRGRSLRRDVALSTVVAGLISSLVGYSSSIAIVFAAARAFGADDAMVTSWVWAVSIGMGLLSIIPSLWWRQPLMVAWSTPGAAVLATSNADGRFTMGDAVGAFLIAGVVFAVIGFSGAFERLMARIPAAVASALLAGALSRFALDGFVGAQSQPLIVISMLVVYLIGRQMFPRYAVVAVLIAGIALAAATGEFVTDQLRWTLAKPVWTSPSFSLQGLVSLAIPLVIVTMAGQNLPGAAVLRSNGYTASPSTMVGWSGIGTIVLGPFGCYSLNLSAITAAICMSPGSHEDPERRYTAAISNGLTYLVFGLFGTSITGFLLAVPQEFVRAIAALALIGAIVSNLQTAMSHEPHREAAALTFLVTLSGVTLIKVGSAFWGVAAGMLALAIPHLTRRGANRR